MTERGDNVVLDQSTKFKDRVFLGAKCERYLIVQLLTTTDLSMEEFIRKPDVSENC